MCGFFISNHPKVNSSHLPIVEKTLRFRGPDYTSGWIENKGWKAYHSRLAIIDLDATMNQPVIDHKGGMLVFNGEILNFKKLGFRYFNRKYTSDTILLSDLILHGKLNLFELDGFFAFVYIDADGKLKKAARDKFGVKPMHYHKENGFYSFSSEPVTLKKIFYLGTNESSIEEYRVTRAPIFSGSYFEKIKIVEPGHCLIGGCYFDCAEYLVGEYSNPSDVIVEEVLSHAILTRQVSDVPVGLLLSKGIDSNLLKELSNVNQYYSIGFKGDADIEYLEAKHINHLKIVKCSEQEYLDDFYYLLNLRGEPMSVPNEVLLYIVARKAAIDGIKVLLSGEGADEFFGGYDRIYKWAANEKTFSLDDFLKLYCYTEPQKGSNLYEQFDSLFSSKDRMSPFEKVRWFFIRYHMPVLFRRLDFSLMAAGVEGREPIANWHVFKVASKLSPQHLIGDNLGKIPLRNIMSRYRGKSFSYEKKVGFPVNLTRVFKNNENASSYDIWFKENIKVLR